MDNGSSSFFAQKPISALGKQPPTTDNDSHQGVVKTSPTQGISVTLPCATKVDIVPGFHVGKMLLTLHEGGVAEILYNTNNGDGSFGKIVNQLPDATKRFYLDVDGNDLGGRDLADAKMNIRVRNDANLIQINNRNGSEQTISYWIFA